MKVEHLLLLACNLAHFPFRKRVCNATVVQKTVILDWSSMSGCSLIDCKLVYLGIGPTALSGNTIIGGQFVFDGPAKNAVLFLDALEKQDPELVRSMFPVVPRVKP